MDRNSFVEGWYFSLANSHLIFPDMDAKLVKTS